MEDDFEEFDFMMFSQLEDTRDVLFSILQDRSLPLTLRMSASEQLTEQYQIRVEEQKEYEAQLEEDKKSVRNAAAKAMT